MGRKTTEKSNVKMVNSGEMPEGQNVALASLEDLIKIAKEANMDSNVYLAVGIGFVTAMVFYTMGKKIENVEKSTMGRRP